LAIGLTGVAFADAGRGLKDVTAVTLIQAHAADDVRSRFFVAQYGASHVAFSASAFTGVLPAELAGAVRLRRRRKRSELVQRSSRVAHPRWNREVSGGGPKEDRVRQL
jgi:hypothetical protein